MAVEEYAANLQHMALYGRWFWGQFKVSVRNYRTVGYLGTLWKLIRTYMWNDGAADCDRKWPKRQLKEASDILIRFFKVRLIPGPAQN